MSATRLTLSNFKAFGPVAQTVPLKPITLVFGPNSAGKSSILHSLLWLQHGLATGELDVHTTLRTKVDLGGFDQLVHGHQPGTRPVIGWSIHGTAIADGVGGWNKFEEFDLELAFQRLPDNPDLIGFLVANRDGPMLKAVRSGRESWTISLFDLEHPAMKRLLEACGSTGPDDFVALSESLVGKLYEIKTLDFLPSQLVPPDNQQGWLISTAIPEAFRLLFEAFRREIPDHLRRLIHIPPLRNLPPRGFDPTRSDEHWRKLVSDPEALATINQWLASDFMGGSRYQFDVVRFIRQDAVQRDLAQTIRDAFVTLFAKENFSDDAAFAMTNARERWKDADQESYLRRCPDYLKAITEKELDAIEADEGRSIEGWDEMDDNQKLDKAEDWAIAGLLANYEYLWLKDPEPHFVEFLREDPEFMEFMSGHLDDNSTGALISSAPNAPAIEQRSELLLRDRRGTVLALQDVGTGISQILPILSSAFAEKNRLITIEQPELHIHPRLQAELGDVFIESALGDNKNTFLIETHSEHLILRILRRIRETTEDEIGDWPDALRQVCPDGIDPEDVAVLYVYVDPGEDGARVKQLRINELGEFIDEWPGGFFDDRMKEVF